MSNDVNLSAFDVESGANAGSKLELLDRQRRKSGEWILLLGADSKEYQERFAEQNRKRLVRLAKIGGPRITHDDMFTESIERLVVCTKDWSFKTKDGQPFPCTAENAERVYRNSVIIREQVEEFINERANFIQD